MYRVAKRTTRSGYYRDRWEQRGASCSTGPEAWDRQADAWVASCREDPSGLERLRERVAAVAAFARQNDLLKAHHSVLDIGCGLGMFTVEFAQTAGRATGIDISPRMVGYAKAYARQHGAENVDFAVRDFKNAAEDLEQEEQYDLVVSCLTPAITGVADLQRVMRLSRGHCLHVSFVRSNDSLAQQIAEALSGGSASCKSTRDGRVFRSLFNLLCLEGYLPRTAYHIQAYREEVAPTLETARFYAASLKKRGFHDVDVYFVYNVIRSLCGAGRLLTREIEKAYGFLLWNTVKSSGFGG